MPSEQIDQDIVYQVAKVAALLHRAADMDHVPTLKVRQNTGGQTFSSVFVLLLQIKSFSD